MPFISSTVQLPGAVLSWGYLNISELMDFEGYGIMPETFSHSKFTHFFKNLFLKIIS
ncbi:hypothetical protein D3C87_554840 [compost metagenome]